MTSAVWQPTVATAGAIDACAHYGTAAVTGTVTIDGINEISGVVASRRRDVLWIEEDSGNPERIYAIDGSGAELATVDVMNADNRDWEDIALTGRRIWLGDIGDNRESRKSIQVYWFREPRPSRSSVSARVLELRYEDGPHNAEAMVVDGARRELFIFTKQAGTTSVYMVSVRGLQGGESITLTKIAELPLNTVTAADLGPEGIIVKSGSGYLYRWTSARTVGASIARTPCRAPAGPGESLGFSRGGGGVGRGLYAIPEGTFPSVYFTPLG
ncbi:MAG: hypothetical protein ABI595_04145 [Actinomycetota bacterium]